MGVITIIDLCDKVAEQFPQYKRWVIDAAVRAFFDAVAQGVRDGHRVQLKGIGRLELRPRKAHIGRVIVRETVDGVPNQLVEYEHAHRAASYRVHLNSKKYALRKRKLNPK